MDFAKELFSVDPRYLLQNKDADERLKAISGHNRAYLAHEYFNKDWHPVYYSDVEKILSISKLGFACSAHYLDYVDQVNMTEPQRKMLSEISDINFQQTVRDYIVNQQFRRDYWVKGGIRLSPLDRIEMIRALRFILATPQGDVPLKVVGAMGEGEFQDEIYSPVLDVLADHKPRSFREVELVVQSKGINFDQLLQVMIVLGNGGHVVLAQEDGEIVAATATSARANANIIQTSRSGADIGVMASPVTGGAVPITRIEQLFLLSLSEGKITPNDWAYTGWQLLKIQNQKLAKDGKPIETYEEMLPEILAQAKVFAEKRLPLLKSLGVA